MTVIFSSCSCCPIDTGCTLPNITEYTLQFLDQRILELAVNISTTKGHAFRPQNFEYTLYAENMNTRNPSTNGCENIFNFTSHETGFETPCPWKYQCDYNPQRIPPFIFHASCNSITPQLGSVSGFCEEVRYPVSYITTESCDPLGEGLSDDWTLETIIVPVACNLRH